MRPNLDMASRHFSGRIFFPHELPDSTMRFSTSNVFQLLHIEARLPNLVLAELGHEFFVPAEAFHDVERERLLAW